LFFAKHSAFSGKQSAEAWQKVCLNEELAKAYGFLHETAMKMPELLW
jgi:hypothetical protein